MRTRLDHTYHGTAYPSLGGGEYDREHAEIVSGAFAVDDYQDGAGVTLDNGEGKRWVVTKSLLRHHGWPKLAVATEAGERERGLSLAIERAESGTALYVWRRDADSPWRITDWIGVPNLDSVRDCGRIDLFGSRGVASLVAQAAAPEDALNDSAEAGRA